MNPKQLMLEDGTKLVNHACGDCGKIWANKRDADEICCRCFICREPMPKGHPATIYNNYHRHCWEAQQAERHAKRVEKADEVADYSGPVYCEEFAGYSDHYFQSLGDLLDHLDDADELEERPAWAFACDIVLCELDADRILEYATQDLHEDAYDHLPSDAIGDFRKACEAFNAAVKASGFQSWQVDYSRKVAVPPADVPTEAQ